MKNFRILFLILFMCSLVPYSLSQTYCSPTITDRTHEKITSITFSPLDYTIGSNLTITVQVTILQNTGYNGYEYARVWFDWDNDYSWENSERLNLGSIYVYNNQQGRIITFATTVVPPTNAHYPSVNVRVNLRWGSNPPTNACGNWARGDTKDAVVYAAGAAAPSLTNITMPTSIAPTTSYRLQFTLSDVDTLIDISTIVVKMYCCGSEPATVSERNYYRFTWRPESPGTWISEPNGFFDLANSTLPADTTQMSFNFALGFRLSAIALPSGTTNHWSYAIAVEDKEHHTANASGTFDVNKYLSYTIPSQVNLGQAQPGQTLPGGSITIVVAANTQIDVTVQGSNADADSNGIPDGNLTSFIAGTQWVMIPMANFFARGDSTIYISTSEQTVYANKVDIPDSISPNVRGYSRNLQLPLSFGGTIPQGIPEGTYTGVWIVTVTNRNVLPA